MTPALGPSAWRRLFTSDGELLRRAAAQSDEATQLSLDGRPREALAAGERAVTMLRQLMTTDPDRALPVLALALRNRSIDLGQLGRLPEAVLAGQEALELSRDARSLTNQAELLLKIGANHEALALTTEALDQAGPLPTAGRGNALTQHLLAQVACGQLEDALVTSAEDLAVWRRVTAEEPFAHSRDLARALGNRANRLRDAARYDEAVGLAAESVELRRRLLAGPGVSLPLDLPLALTGYAVLLAAVGRTEEAVTVAEEAVTRHRAVVSGNQVGHRSHLASALNIHGNRLRQSGRRAEARATLAEAVQLYRELAVVNRAGELPWLAQAVSNYALVLDDPEDQLAATREAVELRRELVATDRPAHLSMLADSMAHLAGRLTEAGRAEEGIAAGQEALALRREFADREPAAGLGDLGWTLLTVAPWLTGAGRLDEGLALGEEAVRVARTAFAGGAEHRSLLARALLDLSDRLELVPGSTKNRRRRISALAAESVALSAG